jgi:hypothetical protein
LRYRLASVVLSVAAAATSTAASAVCTSEQPAFSELLNRPGYTVRGPLSVEQVEKEEMFRIPETGQSVPFGYAHEHWVALKAAVRPGDAIYFVSRTQDRFYKDGHVLVRGGCVIRFILGSIS